MTISAFGVEHTDIAKADRRFTGDRAKNELYLPKHTPGMAAARKAAVAPKAKPIAAAIRDGLRATKI